MKALLEIKKRKVEERQEGQSGYDFSVNVRSYIFHLGLREDDVRLIDYLLSDCEELPEEVSIVRSYFDSNGESIRYYAVRLCIGEDKYPLIVSKADKKLFNFLCDKEFEENEAEE